MLKKLSVVFCGFGVVLLTAGAATAQTAAKAKAKTEAAAQKTAEVVSDAEITTAVKTKLLADKTVSGLKIDVDTTDGVVTLTGPVHSGVERAQALKLARDTKGVKHVTNKLVMEPKPKGTTGKEIKDDTKAVGEKTKDTAEKVGDKTKDAAVKTGQATKNAAEKTGEVITDASITSEVKTKFLASSKVGGLKIDVDTKDHIVTLTGNVKSAEEKAEALRIARASKGVKAVVDHLTVEK